MQPLEKKKKGMSQVKLDAFFFFLILYSFVWSVQ